MAVDSPLSEPPEDVRQPPWPLTKLPALQQNRPGERMGRAHPRSQLRATPHTYCLPRALLALGKTTRYTDRTLLLSVHLSLCHLSTAQPTTSPQAIVTCSPPRVLLMPQAFTTDVPLLDACTLRARMSLFGSAAARSLSPSIPQATPTVAPPPGTTCADRPLLRIVLSQSVGGQVCELALLQEGGVACPDSHKTLRR